MSEAEKDDTVESESVDTETDVKPTQDQLVVQIQESDQSDSGPNRTLTENIKLFSDSRPIFASLFHAIIGACFVPILFVFAAYLLYPAFDFNLLDAVVRRGLLETYIPLFVSLVFARALRPGSLAESHFGWSPILSSGLRQSLKSLIWVWLPLRFVYLGLESFNGGEWNDSLGRILFIIAMLGFTFGVWKTSQGVWNWIRTRQATPHWYAGPRNLLLRLSPAVPASLAVLSLLGYHFTAVEMSWRAMWTLLLSIGVSLLAGLISRLLLITQFRIKLRQLNRDDDGDIDSNESIDIAAISGQVNRLINATAMAAMIVIAWKLWFSVVPAINYLDEYQVWGSMTEKPITLRHLLMAAGLILITYILSQNLPGLLEITILDRLPLDRGGRYAISFVLRYLVIGAGILMTCQIIGFSWAKMQWLAAGLTVGLGFGLQEIFANIVSGIIILLERPVRVGDVVTVNGTTGTVTRMQLRATTITDWDYRELIVPNKKFITEDVLNWTLSDDRSRVVIRVGVAYGSDTELVRSTLIKIASRHPLVSQDPEPAVVFQDFGDSTLNFELRVVVAARSFRVQVLHELNMTVDSIFKEKGIEIAFPQQDIHVKNLGELSRPEIPPGNAA